MNLRTRIAAMFRRAPVAKHAQRGFDAAALTRLTADWLATYASINWELRNDLDRLRNRARDLAKNDDYVARFLRMVARNTVGPAGFKLQARIYDAPNQPDTLANKTIESHFEQWSRRGSCDSSGKLSFADLCRGAIKAVARDGEALIGIVRGADARNPYGIALTLYDSARLDTLYNVAPVGGSGPIITMGVEHDRFGRALAYHMLESNPGDPVTVRRRVRVDAADMLHLYVQDQPEQMRGYPWIHSAMLRLHHLHGYQEAAIIASRIGASKMGMYVAPDGTPPDGEKQPDGSFVQSAEPGEFGIAPPGYDFKTFDPSYPHQQYDMFVKACLRGIASGMDISYSTLANDLEGVNFSSIRSGVLEERDGWMTIQGWFTEALLRPVYDQWLRNALALGAITLPNGSALPLARLDKFAAHQWQGRRWAWVDPLRDVEASIAAVNAGLKSRRDVIGESGNDVEDVFEQLAAEAALAQNYGLVFAAPAANPAQAGIASASGDTGTGRSARTPLRVARSADALCNGLPVPLHTATDRVHAMKPQPGTKLTREFLITREAINVEARTVELAFSSETPVERWYGTEILDHSPGAIRLDRIRATGSLLLDHDPEDLVGAIRAITIGADRVGRAQVQFGRGQQAAEVFQDVVDDIRRNVSVAYIIHDAKLTSTGDNGDVYTITDWEPTEISLVAVPADITVGVGRSDSDQPSAPPTTPAQEATRMNQQQVPATPDSPGAPAAPVNVAEIEQRARSSEQDRVREIMAIGESFRAQGIEPLAMAAVRSGTALEAFRVQVMQHLSERSKPVAAIGLNQQEIQRYSVVRALHALANPTDHAAREAAAFEFECSRAAADKTGRTVKGVLVPHDVLTRELNVGTASAGGNTVATNLLAGDFIAMLRNAMVIDQLGVRMLSGLVGNIAVPRMSGGGTGYWVNESVAPTASQQSIDQVAMSPKTLGARTQISRKLLLQSSMDVESMVRQDLATVLGLELQRAAINGSGTAPEPRGVLNVAGIGSVAGGANGAAPTLANIIALETAIASANAEVGTLAYLTNAKVRGKLKSTQRITGTDSRMVWGEGPQPLNGYAASVSNTVPSNLTKGTSAGVCSAILFGNWSDLLIGLWGGLELQVDPYSAGDTGSVVVRAFQDADVAVRHPESFAAMADALTT